MHYICNKIRLNRSRSYIDSPKWINSKKTTKNLKDNNDTFFQYVMALVLKREQTKIDFQKITNIFPHINQYEWKDINFPSLAKEWKKLETNNKSIALNVSFIPHKQKEIRQA